MWNECNYAVVWTFLALSFFGIGMKTDLLQSCGHCWVFQIYWHWVMYGSGPCDKFGSFSVIVVFILSALWCRRIRGLWQLPDGRDWLRGKLGLVLMGGAMLSKSLIQFSIDGWSCYPSLLFTWGPTMVEVMKIMVTSFKRSHGCTATLSDPIRDWPRLAQECPGVSAEVWVCRGLLQGWDTEGSSASWDRLKEVTIVFITSTIVWPQAK